MEMAVSKLSEIQNREVFTEGGLKVGTLYDVAIESATGRIHGLLLNRVTPEFAERCNLEPEKKILIPYGAVRSIGDIILIASIAPPPESEE
jgi:sporulation protein YlmC with PRC-barrel domain